MKKFNKRLRSMAKSLALRGHEALLPLGIIAIPNHYYASMPDLRDLRKTRDQWAKRSELTGVNIDLDQQVAALKSTVAPFSVEYHENEAYRSATEGAYGPGYGYIEAQALHGVVRSTKPKRIIEIGSGVSTYCMLHAAAKNAAEGRETSITCIEPYPSEWLEKASVKLLRARVETVDLAIFDTLGAGDMLFVDSSHAVRTGGDVLHIVLTILPRLQPGVLVHFHDVYLPYDYQRDADRSLFQWMETALLHAYLIDNSRMNILFCLSHLHYDRPDALREVFPDYQPEPDADGLQVPSSTRTGHFPSSLYLSVGAPVFSKD